MRPPTRIGAYLLLRQGDVWDVWEISLCPEHARQHAFKITDFTDFVLTLLTVLTMLTMLTALTVLRVLSGAYVANRANTPILYLSQEV